MERLAIYADDMACSPDCDTSLLEGIVRRVPLRDIRLVGLLWWRRLVGWCVGCGETFELRPESMGNDRGTDQ